MDDKSRDIKNTDWRTKLDDVTYHVTREHGTEAPFSGKYNDFFKAGSYTCVCCGHTLFASETKFNAGCGWPSFTRPIEEDAVTTRSDHSHGMVRVEVLCPQCDAHLGHVFEDGPPEDGGQRYCMNSVALAFKPEDEEPFKPEG